VRVRENDRRRVQRAAELGATWAQEEEKLHKREEQDEKARRAREAVAGWAVTGEENGLWGERAADEETREVIRWQALTQGVLAMAPPMYARALFARGRAKPQASENPESSNKKARPPRGFVCQ
jgi:hypothetical protein